MHIHLRRIIIIPRRLPQILIIRRRPKEVRRHRRPAKIRVARCSSTLAKVKVKSNGPRILTSAIFGLLVRQASIRQSHPMVSLMLRPNKKARITYGRSVPALMTGGIP